MTKLQEAKQLLAKVGYKVVREGSFNPSNFEYVKVPEGDNKSNTAKATGVRYAKSGNIHEGQGGLKAILEARQILRKAGYKLVREGVATSGTFKVQDEKGSLIKRVPGDSESITKAANFIKGKPGRALVAEAMSTLRRAGYKAIREDIDVDPNSGYPAETIPVKANIHAHDTGRAEHVEQSYPASSTEKGDLREALNVIRKAGLKATRIKEFRDDSDYYRNDVELAAEDSLRDEDFDFGEYEDLDYIDELTADAANFDEAGFLQDDVI